MSTPAIRSDTVVTLSYVLFDAHGQAVERTSPAEPLTYVHGYAQIVPGLERALEGLQAGDRREIVLEAADAFGEHDEAGVLEIDLAELPQGVAVGDELEAQGPEGESMSFRVIELSSEAARVDVNHPLAGQQVRFEVHVEGVRAATEDEIAGAQAELEERIEESDDACCAGHDHAGHDHTHDHGHEHDPLVKLSTKH